MFAGVQLEAQTTCVCAEIITTSLGQDTGPVQFRGDAWLVASDGRNWGSDVLEYPVEAANCDEHRKEWRTRSEGRYGDPSGHKRSERCRARGERDTM